MMSDLAKKVAKTKKVKVPKVPVNLVGYQYQGRSMFNPTGTDGRKAFFSADSVDFKDVYWKVERTQGLGLGIGCMVKVYKVDGEGKETYLYTLFPAYKVRMTRGSTSVSTYAKPECVVDESLTLQQTLPPGL